MQSNIAAKRMHGHSPTELTTRSPMSISQAMRTRQTKRIREIRQALIEAGFVSLDQQAAALGLSRSTTWAVLQGNHKCSGLRAALLARVLAAPNLPGSVRTILVTYINEKAQGAYGHNDLQRQHFIFRLKRFGGPSYPQWASQPAPPAIRLNQTSASAMCF